MEEKKFCPHCGSALEPGANFCPNCGQNTSSTEYTAQAETKKSTYTYEKEPSYAVDNSYATMTLVFGILSIFFSWILAIIGLVFSGKADPSDVKTKVGKGLCIFTIVYNIVLVVFVNIYIAVVASRAATI